MEGWLLAVESHEALKHFFLQLFSAIWKVHRLQFHIAEPKTSFCVFNVKNVERKFPEREVWRKHDSDVIKVSSCHSKKLFSSRKSLPKARQHPAGAKDPLSHLSAQIDNHLHRCCIFFPTFYSVRVAFRMQKQGEFRFFRSDCVSN